MKRRSTAIAMALALTLAGTVAAQWRRSSGYGRRDLESVEDFGPGVRGHTPLWENDKGFKKDVFTFARVRYASHGYGSGGSWNTDVPDSDVNLAFRLQQLTSLKVDPWGKFVELTDERLFDYPFIYIVEPGRLEFNDEEVAALRKYLFSGGFLMVDDFWGGDEYDNFYHEIKKVLPEPKYEPQELPLEHPIFHCVYDLKAKPQIPGVEYAIRNKGSGITTERPWDPRGVNPDYRAIFDEKGHIMVMMCHNTDLGDGWEEEGTDEWYFHEFSEKKGYPMGINIIFYAMTH